MGQKSKKPKSGPTSIVAPVVRLFRIYLETLLIVMFDQVLALHPGIWIHIYDTSYAQVRKNLSEASNFIQEFQMAPSILYTAGKNVGSESRQRLKWTKAARKNAHAIWCLSTVPGAEYI